MRNRPAEAPHAHTSPARRVHQQNADLSRRHLPHPDVAAYPSQPPGVGRSDVRSGSSVAWAMRRRWATLNVPAGASSQRRSRLWDSRFRFCCSRRAAEPVLGFWRGCPARLAAGRAGLRQFLCAIYKLITSVIIMAVIKLYGRERELGLLRRLRGALPRRGLREAARGGDGPRA